MFKKLDVLFLVLLAGFFLIACSSYNNSKRSKEWNVSKDKASKMQQLIKFDDEKTYRIANVEYEYNANKRKIENCVECNKKIENERLEKLRTIQLKNILDRDEYIKYDAIDKERIKNIKLIAK